MCNMTKDIETTIAERLRTAERTASSIEPFANEIGDDDILAAYRIQQINVENGMKANRRFRGRKIGLTARSVQEQLGVNEPDYGTLFSDMEITNGGTLDLSALINPRVEAEIAFVLSHDIDEPSLSHDALEGKIGFAVSALEIVDSRLKNWRIGILDTIADNGASSRFVLGDTEAPISEIDLANSRMELRRNGEIVSSGTGADTLGHPLKALGWLADTLIEHGRPLYAGDLVLTGALGPVSTLASGDRFEATFDELSPVTLRVK